VRSVNEKTIPEEVAQYIAELGARVADLSRRVQSIEDDQATAIRANPTDLTIHSYDDDESAIHLLTENGFVIVRPWEANNVPPPAAGAFPFRVESGDGIDREVSVGISDRLLKETTRRTHGRIQPADQFWICCAERRLANYLMEHDEFPSANEMIIDLLDREDLMLAIRWGKSG
jgi:hypothetical protein